MLVYVGVGIVVVIVIVAVLLLMKRKGATGEDKTPADMGKDAVQEEQSEETVAEQPQPEPAEEPEPVVEESIQEPEPVIEPIQEPEPEAEAEEEPPEEGTTVVEPPVVESEPVTEQPVQEPEPANEDAPEPEAEAEEEPPAEEPKPEPVEKSEPVVEEPVQETQPSKVNTDFMSKLVASKNVGKGAQATGPKEDAEPAEPVTEQPVQESDGIPTETGEVFVDDDEPMEDIYTDYSPEALVRRAAWNKGLRCRRNYGGFNIPVAFVKGKVAVYVDDAEDDPVLDSILESDGWLILRFKASEVTDGHAEAEKIAEAVKANIRQQKSSKKKKPAKK